MTSAAIPVPPSDRAHILDILRGFAILGIFMANSAGFALYIFATEAAKKALPTYPTDKWLEHFMDVFIDGKFYSLFSLLFGIGFTIILDRNQRNGKNPLAVFYRRIFILALLGLGHLLLLWPGDILFLYALIGMVLPLFRNLKNKTLLILTACLILSPLLFDLAKILSEGKWDLSHPFAGMAIKLDTAYGIDGENFRSYVVDHPTYQAIFQWSQGGFFWRFEHIVGSNRIPKVLAMFLIGLVAGRTKIYSNLEGNKNLLKKIQKWGYIIGLPTSIGLTISMHDEYRLPDAAGIYETLFYALSVIPLSMAYTSSMCLLWLQPKWQSVLRILAPVGRMALTNYIVQTLVGIFIYYGIGLGLANRTGPTVYLPIAVFVYFFQVIYSNIWFRYFAYGPLEWMWRQLTYGRFLKITKPAVT